ncbi:MAG: universal stress protein [Deltaproteobacteria bacterium]|nr:universal stress protein [Deltaproteobacteria bacterium]
MKKRVLLAIDLEAPASWAASYAVQLAARLELSLILMAILAPPRRQAAAAKRAVSMAELKEDQRLWLGKIRERCQQEGVEVEIFISAGSFCQEVLRFAQAQSSLQFIIMGFPGDVHSGGQECSPSALQHLRRQLEGEILLVRGQGKVMRLTENSGQQRGREN